MIVFDKTEHANLKNAKRIEEIHSELLTASRGRDTKRRKELLAELDAKIIEHQALIDQTPIFTCVSCGADFPQGRHVDIIAKSVVMWDETGSVEQWIDDGELRHFKLCGTCVAGFSIHPRDYAQAR